VLTGHIALNRHLLVTGIHSDIRLTALKHIAAHTQIKSAYISNDIKNN